MAYFVLCKEHREPIYDEFMYILLTYENVMFINSMLYENMQWFAPNKKFLTIYEDVFLLAFILYESFTILSSKKL